MEYRTDALGIRFIHWEFQKSSAPISDLDPTMRILPVVKPNTKIKNGLLFRHSVKWYQANQLTLNCIAEEVFINDGICSFTFKEIKNLIQVAFERFNTAFENKIKSEGHLGASIIYTVKDDEVNQTLLRLKG